MKKSLLLLGILCLFTMTSCGGNDEAVNSTLYPSDSSNTIDPNGDLLPPSLVEPSYSESVDTNASPSTQIEATVDKVYDSVVSIEAYSTTALSRGSGVLFASDDDLNMSFVVTCHHVIAGGDRFYVKTTDGKDYKALVVGAYIDKDLAVLSIEGTGLTYAKFFDDANKLKLGSTVVCIGNPLGTLPGSVSSGIVSYVNRKVPVDEYSSMNLIQTDVAINSGNSGGGLFNTAGNLIGIVNAKYSSEGIEGLGFAIPINDVRKTVSDIMATAKYDKANNIWQTGYVKNDYELAFHIKNGYYQNGSFINPDYTQVVYITDIVSGDVYSGSGKFKDEDVIKAISVDFKSKDKKKAKLDKFTSASEVMKFLSDCNLEVGDSITFKIDRDNRTLDVSFDIVQFRYSM